MKKRELNPTLEPGDRVMLLHMSDELTRMPMGLEGTFNKYEVDTFDPNDKLIYVNWDNGSKLPLISSTDSWIRIEKKIDEQVNNNLYNFFSSNPDVFDFFDYKFFKDYLEIIRLSGIVNMYGSSHLLYTGKDWIMGHFSDEEENENFDKLLELADESKTKMIEGTLKYLNSKNKEYDVDLINRELQKFANKLVQFFIVIH